MDLDDAPLDTSQIEDRRGMGMGRGGLAVGGGLGVIGTVVVLLMNLLGGGGGGGFGVNSPFEQLPGTGAPLQPGQVPASDDTTQFVTRVVNNVQAHWERQFAQSGRSYTETKLVLFNGPVNTGGCGTADPSVGPFYCPADMKVYLDPSFFQQLGTQFGAPGDFAQAYVIAHEFGHHVQNLLGIERQMRAEQQQNPEDENELSVRFELQADCLAGVWGHSAFEQRILETGDVEEGLAAAASVGDDRLQQQAGRRVNEEAFTHGSSAQRQKWFTRGFESGTTESCDTFSGGA